MSAPPGSARGLHLMVTDIVAAREELVGADYNSLSEFADPDGNVWLLQERGHHG